jgi:hypothetical protein
MNNLDNSEILSDEIVSAIDTIIAQIPDAIFGGSIALNGVGLLNRKISDIDVFFGYWQSLSKNGFTQLPTTEFLSDTVTNINGKEIQRTGLKINGVKVCAFKVDNEELQCSSVSFIRNEKTRTIKIQNVNYAIQAKIAYSSKTQKHKDDLSTMDGVLNALFPGDLIITADKPTSEGEKIKSSSVHGDQHVS